MNSIEFNDLCLYAFRYALGRKTYAVDDVCSIIKEHIPDLTDNTLRLIMREIKDAIRRQDAGMKCNTTMWELLADDILEYLLRSK